MNRNTNYKVAKTLSNVRKLAKRVGGAGYFYFIKVWSTSLF